MIPFLPGLFIERSLILYHFPTYRYNISINDQILHTLSINHILLCKDYQKSSHEVCNKGDSTKSGILKFKNLVFRDRSLKNSCTRGINFS